MNAEQKELINYLISIIKTNGYCTLTCVCVECPLFDDCTNYEPHEFLGYAKHALSKIPIENILEATI